MVFYYITYTNGESVFVIKRLASHVGETVTEIVKNGEKLICVALEPTLQPLLP